MLWVKAFHIIAVVAWFAGLFYLPRLYVYHAESSDEISNQRFKIMERRLYYGIMTPAGIVASALGFWLLYYGWPVFKEMGWMHAKLGLVGLLWIYHLRCGHHRKQFAKDTNRCSPYFFRVFNEISTVFLILIVILVTVQPF